MKKIGLLGGMTCESSIEYYKLINEITREKLGGIHSAESIMVSVDFGNILPWMEAGKWDLVLDKLISSSLEVEKGGGEFLVICTNTMHKLADQIAEKINIPILNIIDVTAEKIKKKGLSKIGLLGTRFTMVQDFYRKRLERKHNIKVVIPDKSDISYIHKVIIEELTIGKIVQKSKSGYWKIIKKLQQKGAEGIILGCTEIPLLVKQEEGNIPLFDTTSIHASAAVELSLSK